MNQKFKYKKKFKYNNGNAKSSWSTLRFCMRNFNGENLTKYGNKIQIQISRKIHAFVHNNKKAS